MADKSGAPQEFQAEMDFIKGCRLSYAMVESPTLYCQIMEKVWTSAIFDSRKKVLTFNVKGKTYYANNDDVTTCLKLFETNYLSGPTPNDIMSMLNFMGYALETFN